MLLHQIKVRVLSHRAKIATTLLFIILLFTAIEVSGIMDKSEEYAKIAALENELVVKESQVQDLTVTIDKTTEVMEIKDSKITELENVIFEHKTKVDALSEELRYTKTPTSRGTKRQGTFQDLYINTENVNESSNLSKNEMLILAEYAGLESCIEELYTLDQNNVNVFFTLAVAMTESSYQSIEAGKSNVAKKYNNLFGATANSGGFIYYDSFNESILKFGDFITSGYFEKGLTSLSKINPVYCPPNNPGWRIMVSAKIDKLFEHLKETKGF